MKLIRFIVQLTSRGYEGAGLTVLILSIEISNPSDPEKYCIAF